MLCNDVTRNIDKFLVYPSSGLSTSSWKNLKLFSYRNLLWYNTQEAQIWQRINPPRQNGIDFVHAYMHFIYVCVFVQCKHTHTHWEPPSGHLEIQIALKHSYICFEYYSVMYTTNNISRIPLILLLFIGFQQKWKILKTAIQSVLLLKHLVCRQYHCHLGTFHAIHIKCETINESK